MPDRSTQRGARLESELNKELQPIIPVVYGALLSYAMYVFARLVISAADTAPDRLLASGWLHLALEFLPALGLFFAFSLFLVEDMGEVIKLGASFPFKRTSRYSHEILIASWFLSAFALLEAKNLLALLAFSLAIIQGGVWCNQLKEEYAHDATKIAAFATTQRNLQYTGGFLFLAEAAIFLIITDSTVIHWICALVFLASFGVWLWFYATLPPMRHGPDINTFLVNTIVPDGVIVQRQADRFRPKKKPQPKKTPRRKG